MRLRSSLAIRLTGALIAATFLATGSILGGIYYFSVKRPMEEVREQVRSEAISLEATYRRDGESALKAALLKRRQSPSPNKAFDAFLERTGSLVLGNLPSWPLTRRGDWTTIEADLYRDGDEDDHESLSRDMMLPEGKRLIVGRDVEVIADRKELMVEASRWGAVAVILFGLLGGLLISRITGRRLGAVRGTARAIMQGDLSVRVPIKRNGDEFDELALSINAMLDRNQELVATLGRVSDSIAHELRTPLARLHSTLEEAAGKRGMNARQVDAARTEVERLQLTFDSLLRIARLDTGRHRINRDPVQLDELVSDAVEFYAPEAETRGQYLTSSVDRCVVVGDRNLLFQAVSNLLDNAIKFAAERGEVRVELTADRTDARVTVTDNGPGVDEVHLQRITEPFFRAPGSEGVAGTGLGLSLVSAISTAHGGTLAFDGGRGKFRVSLTLPISARPHI